MQVHYNIKELPEFERAVITIGAFDGVHLGHRQIIQQLIESARSIDGTDVLITFFPHPKKVVGSPDYQIRLLNTLEEKIGLLAATGLSHLVVVPFSEAFASMSAETYIADFLVKQFHPHTIITGYDHRFGSNRTGDIDLLRRQSTTFNYRVTEIPEYLIKNNSISSTKIREAITDGLIDKAAELLGYAYFFSGTVVKGQQIGRTIGFPTANIQVDNEEKLIPGLGVYAVEVHINSSELLCYGMMNIGKRPTFDGNSITVEVNIFDFNRDLYGARIKIIPLRKIRSEMKFESAEALSRQLMADEAEAKNAVNH